MSTYSPKPGGDLPRTRPNNVVPRPSAGSKRWRTTATIPTVLSLAVLGLGLAVMAGWVLRIPALTQVLPGLTSMVFNTALCFALMSTALLFSADPAGQAPRLPRLLAAAVASLVTLNLIQIAAGVSLGINLPALHDWMRDGNPVPGQMATPTSVEFLLAGLIFLAQRHAGVGRRFARAANVLMLAVAAMALAGYLLRLEALYSWYAFGRMALHTAIGMLLLALSLWLRQNEMDAHDNRPIEARILALGSWTLVLIALVAGLTGAWILKAEADRELRRGVQLAHRARIDVLSTTLELRAARAALLASRPALRAMLKTPFSGNTGNASDVFESLAEFGFSSAELRSPEGWVRASTGEASGAALAVELGGKLSGAPLLAWRQGLVLIQRFEIREGPRLLGTLLTEQPLTQIDRLLDPAAESEDIELCGAVGERLVCFPNRSSTTPYQPQAAAHIDRMPVLEAHGGKAGVDLFRDAGGQLSVAAYGPVADTGLFASSSRPGADLFAPLRQRVGLGFFLIALVTAAGALILRRGIRPLTEALAEAQRRYRAVVDNLHEGVMLLDARAAVLASNPAAAEILGLRSDQLNTTAVGNPGWRLIHPDGRPCDVQDYPSMRALRSGVGERNTPMGVLDAEGRLRWLDISTVPIHDSGSGTLLLTFDDVTEKRLTQQRLHESEQRYELMVDQVSDYAVMMLDTQGHVMSWNQGAQRIFGYAEDEVLGMHFALFFSEEDRVANKPQAELDDGSLRGRCEAEGWRLRKDGTRFWAMGVLTAVHDERGQLMGYAKVTRDLTERHRAEQAVAEARRRVQAMIDSSPFGIVATDLSGIIIAMNPAGERMTGYTREELVGKLTPAVYHDPEEIFTRAHEMSGELGRIVEPGLEVFVHRARQGMSDEREWTCVRKDGLRFPVHSAITALRDAEGAIVGFMGVAYDISERKRQEEYTRHIAHHDFLTGLPMRRLLEDRLGMAMKRALRDGRKVGLMMLDLDHFKRINDSLGHHVGDELLKNVAERLQECVRESDTVARMGGDEFVILLPDLTDLSQAERVARLAVERVSVPMRIGAHELHMSPSVGVALFPDDADDAAVLLKNADAAMYAAKSAGRGCHRVFSRYMQQDADDRVLIERDLRTALQKEQLELHYQPQICLRSGDVMGMEALLRWTHPQRGAISPAVFIPIAEESGLILPLGEWVLRESCRAAKRLQEKTGVALRLAVNLSPRQFRSPRLAECVRDALSESGLDAPHLELEITEGVLMDNVDEVIQRLVEIRRSGVSVAVDDFGVGYSSLSYITRFAIDTLKIDRCFVSRMLESPGDAAVAEAILALSRSLGIKVVAEGVETAEQLAFLRSRRCDQAQGYLLGMPGPEQQFSVQGFHFAAATSEERFAEEFVGLQAGSRARIRELH